MSIEPASFGPTVAVRRQGDGRARWVAAFVLALLLHAALGVTMSWIGWATPPLKAAPTAPISFVFEPAKTPATSPQQQQPQQPDEFSELPTDRADLKPEHPDFLSNLDSRARDRAEGGQDGGLPRMTGQSESPHVAMQPAEDVPQGGKPQDAQGTADHSQESSADRPQDAQHALGAQGGPTPKDPAAIQREAQLAERRPSSGDPRRDLLRNGSAMATPSLARTLGISDIFQEEMDNPTGNVQLFGDVSLNTIQWAYAPWLQRFLRDVGRNWRAPYAYYPLGVIHGYTLVELEIEKTGRVARMDVLQEEGHESLRESSIAALRSTAPFQPLPADFPEPTLILRLKMIYPELRR